MERFARRQMGELMPLFSPPPPDTHPKHTIVESVRQRAAERPDSLAVICGQSRISWLDFDCRINRVANALHSLGVGRDDRVAVLASTSVEYLEVFMGTLRAGACLVPLSTMASTEALQKMLVDCSAKVLFLSDSMRSLIETSSGTLEAIVPHGRIALDFEATGWSDYEQLLASVEQSDPRTEIGLGDLFNIIYSSGTTGIPKGISHDHMMRAVQMERIHLFGYDQTSRTLLSTPLYSNTTIVALLPTLVGGGTVVLMPKFEANAYLQLVEDEKCTHTMLVPVQYKRIMDVPDFDAFDLSSMAYKFSTSAPLRAAVKKDVLDRFPGWLVEYYGLTEGGGTTILLAHEFPDKLHTVGVPAPGVELKFIDENGQEVANGQMGEICGRSPTMMLGYFGREDLTDQSLWKDEAGRVFFRSGDMGFADEDGFIHLADRKKDMIISGGLNIYANDLELALLQDADVEDAAVIGVPSEEWGETPIGLVVLRDGAERSTQEILVQVNASLGKSQRLAALEQRQSLPRSTIGKILKRELRQPYWQDSGRRI